jgi:hypothetical protein
MGLREASPLFFVKRGLCCFVFLQASLLHLAGLGGEGVEKGGPSWCFIAREALF